MSPVCSSPSAPEHVLTVLASLTDCCYDAATEGPTACTCWVPIYDLDQQRPDTTAEPATRKLMCGDCAYRPDSPEKVGDPGYRGDANELERIAAQDRFWCHDGMRKPIKWRHPSGIEVDGHPGGYDPPTINGVPYKADGSPGVLCAGWDARRRALEANGG